MEEGIIWGIIIIAVIVGLATVFFRYFIPIVTNIIPALYFALAALAFFVFYILDQAFSTAFFPRLPWLMWIIWGMIFGAAAGCWTIAPVYGWRQYRPWIAWAPLLLMLAVMGLCLLIKGVD